MGFTLSHFISQFPPTQFPLLTAIGMCHFLPVHHLGIAFFGPGRRSKDNSYETIEEMKEAVTKVVDTLTQENFHGTFQKFWERYNKCIEAGGLEFHVCTINKSAHAKKVWKLIECISYM